MSSFVRFFFENHFYFRADLLLVAVSSLRDRGKFQAQLFATCAPRPSKRFSIDLGNSPSKAKRGNFCLLSSRPFLSIFVLCAHVVSVFCSRIIRFFSVIAPNYKREKFFLVKRMRSAQKPFFKSCSLGVCSHGDQMGNLCLKWDVRMKKWV